MVMGSDKQLIFKTGLRNSNQITLMIYEDDTYETFMIRLLDKMDIYEHRHQYKKIVIYDNKRYYYHDTWTYDAMLDGGTYNIKITR